jgi:flagellar secretion chaperone FliS
MTLDPTTDRTATEGTAPMNALVRDRYLGDTVATGSPHTLLLRLYDRLVLDLQGAEQAIAERRLDAANQLLGHAQDIIVELRSTLQVDAWEGGPGLAALYDFCRAELVQANVAKDAARTAGVRTLLEPLRDAWRDAASHLAAGAGVVAGATLSA